MFKIDANTVFSYTMYLLVALYLNPVTFRWPYRLELAGKGKETDYILQNNDSCIAMYKSTLRTVKEALLEIVEVSNTIKFHVGQEESNLLLLKLSNTLENMNPIEIGEIWGEVEAIQFNEEQSIVIESISKDISNYDYVEALEKIKELI